MERDGRDVYFKVETDTSEKMGMEWHARFCSGLYAIGCG